MNSVLPWLRPGCPPIPRALSLGHGVHWKWLMQRCGVPPDKAVQEHEIKEEFRRPRERLLPGLTIVRCGCTGHRKIPNRRAQRIRRGERQTCEICRQPLRLS